MCKTISLEKAVGTVLAYDITEIRPGEFKGRIFKKGHIIEDKDICHLQRLGKEKLYVLEIGPDEMHENDAAYAIAEALAGEGVELSGEPVEGKINLIAARNGLLTVDKERLLKLNMLGDVMCATMHNNSVVKAGKVVAGTRAIPLVVKRRVIEEAVEIAGKDKTNAILEVRKMRKPKVGVIITGNEVYQGRVNDGFKPVLARKVREIEGQILEMFYAPDDESFIEMKTRELIHMGADLLILTGGMSVDPDDVTRFAIRRLGATDITYGSAVLPGAMFLVAYISTKELKIKNASSEFIPILGIPACGMYHNITVFDIILPRILAGEKLGRRELSELGHGGLCLNCKECRYPVCSFGKGA